MKIRTMLLIGGASLYAYSKARKILDKINFNQAVVNTVEQCDSVAACMAVKGEEGLTIKLVDTDEGPKPIFAAVGPDMDDSEPEPVEDPAAKVIKDSLEAVEKAFKDAPAQKDKVTFYGDSGETFTFDANSNQAKETKKHSRFWKETRNAFLDPNREFERQLNRLSESLYIADRKQESVGTISRYQVAIHNLLASRAEDHGEDEKLDNVASTLILNINMIAKQANELEKELNAHELYGLAEDLAHEEIQRCYARYQDTVKSAIGEVLGHGKIKG